MPTLTTLTRETIVVQEWRDPRTSERLLIEVPWTFAQGRMFATRRGVFISPAKPPGVPAGWVFESVILRGRFTGGVSPDAVAGTQADGSGTFNALANSPIVLPSAVIQLSVRQYDGANDPLDEETVPILFEHS